MHRRFTVKQTLSALGFPLMLLSMGSAQAEIEASVRTSCYPVSNGNQGICSIDLGIKSASTSMEGQLLSSTSTAITGLYGEARSQVTYGQIRGYTYGSLALEDSQTYGTANSVYTDASSTGLWTDEWILGSNTGGESVEITVSGRLTGYLHQTQISSLFQTNFIQFTFSVGGLVWQSSTNHINNPWAGLSGYFDIPYQLTGLIPVGTPVQVVSQLVLSSTPAACSAPNGTCFDYAEINALNTATLDTIVVPAGVTITSESGMLIESAPGVYAYAAAVPEPETWAMLLAGLGLVGFAAAKRRA